MIEMHVADPAVRSHTEPTNRLVVPLYLYGCPENFIHLLFSDYRPDYRVRFHLHVQHAHGHLPSHPTPPSLQHPQMCAALVTWQALQVAVLFSQDFWGPQYMIPARFLPPKYDYYRPIPQQALRRGGAETGGSAVGQAGQPVGPGGEGEDAIEMTDIEGGELPECVICYNGIDVAGPGEYMVSPCDHLFHRACLERWMDIKLECPVCRAALPMR